MEVGKTLGSLGTEVRRAETAPGYAHPASGNTAESARTQDAGELNTAAPAREPAPAILASWVAADPISLRLITAARTVAGSASCVLIRGESGVGKGLLAQVIHYVGPYAHGPLLEVDCAALPPEVIEAELFGYEQGSFAGTANTKRGCLELAGAGTIVLKEVAALALPLQAKLLRVLEEGKLDRLGGIRSVPVAARVVALTAVDLEGAVVRRTFREDLYFRLSAVPLMVRPLRERPGDIRALAEHFLRRLSEVHRKPRMAFSTEAMAVLEAYSYPGNVRELRNMVERAVMAGAGPDVVAQDFPPHLRDAALGGRTKISLEELERQYIAEVLDHTHGKKTLAAHILGISRKTLLEKRKRYGLD